MTPEERLTELEREVTALKALRVETKDSSIFEKDITMFDGRSFRFGGNKGTKLGISASQKIGLYGVTPIVQQGTISPASGGATVDSQARTVITNIINALKNIGITA